MTEQPPEYMVLKKEGAARTGIAELQKAIERIIDELATAYSAADYEQPAAICIGTLDEVCGLIQSFGLLLSGMKLQHALGAPGDWGYDTDIGKAIHRLYSDGIGNQILRAP